MYEKLYRTHRIRTASHSCEYACGYSNYQNNENASRTYHTRTVSRSCEFKDRAIITHCGGGGRGQKSKEWLEKEGFTNVVNGGGPQVSELWDMFGHL